MNRGALKEGIVISMKRVIHEAENPRSNGQENAESRIRRKQGPRPASRT
jgi:hypothetical protein